MKIISHISQTEQNSWNAPLATQYNSWYYEVCEEKWDCFSDIQDHYLDAECHKPGKVIFHILKNKAVIYAHVEYAIGWVYVRFVGTNSDFDNFLKKEKEAA